MNSLLFSPLILRPSRSLKVFSVLLYCLAVVVIMVLPASLLVKALLLLVVAASLLWHWRTARHCKVLQLIPETAEEPWRLFVKDRGWVTAQLRGSQVARYLVILYFKLENDRRCTVLVPADAVDGNMHRRLRTMLLTHRLASKQDDICQ